MFKRIIRAFRRRKNMEDMKESFNTEISSNLYWDAPCIARSQTEVLERIKKARKNL